MHADVSLLILLDESAKRSVHVDVVIAEDEGDQLAELPLASVTARYQKLVVLLASHLVYIIRAQSHRIKS
jgi:hypothetical protein